MRLLAIDPGPRQSAWVVLDVETQRPLAHAITANDELRQALRGESITYSTGKISYYAAEHLAIEMVASYGMSVGKDVFETAVWIGRFIEAWSGPHSLVYRKDVKLTLCGDSRARDSNVRQALIDRYPPTGGGRLPQVGTKAKPGPLYGIRRDVWAALAVAVTWIELLGRRPTA